MMRSCKRLVSTLLIVCLAGLGLPAHAGMLSTQAGVASADRAHVYSVLEREDVRAQLQARVTRGDVVLDWRELSPELAGHLRQDTVASRIITGIIILIVLLGVASAQLAAVLERRREFAVLAALGMRGGRMVRLLLQEALALGLAGAAAGILLGSPFVWRFATAGLDFRKWMGSSLAFQGILIEPILYADFGPWIVPEALVIGLGATLIASLYPAWYATRTDPAKALRVAQ